MTARRCGGRPRAAPTVLALLAALPLALSPAVRTSGSTPGEGAGIPDFVRNAGPEGPAVRIGVAVNLPTASLSSPAGLRLEDALTGQPAGEVGPGGQLLARADGAVLRLEGLLENAPSGSPSVRVYPARGGEPIIIDGLPYRGSAELRVAAGDRVSAINVISLEDYLLGVVPLEIGPRDAEELAAVEAQAVAARTYAVAQLGRNFEQGFDLFGSVEDQAYGGMEAERVEATEAVRRTAGMILMFDGRPIRAYYHSTCGGRTAAIDEVLDREPVPYLRSVSDRAPDGTDYCAASPRYRWSIVWSADQLDSVARVGLAAHFKVPVNELGRVESLEVMDTTASGRVRDLAFHGEGMELVLSRLDIRRALPQEGRILNSTDFSIVDRSDGLVELDGRGYGHGAGMCQWGAIGRARAGQDYAQILTTYYPGATLVHVYEGDEG